MKEVMEYLSSNDFLVFIFLTGLMLNTAFVSGRLTVMLLEYKRKSDSRVIYWLSHHTYAPERDIKNIREDMNGLGELSDKLAREVAYFVLNIAIITLTVAQGS